jgi:protein required for attachment to host cells
MDRQFDRLVLIAPATMLGGIKKHLNEKILKLVVAEMPKDLTHSMLSN